MTATKAEALKDLQQIPGIGKKMAEDFVAAAMWLRMTWAIVRATTAQVSVATAKNNALPTVPSNRPMKIVRALSTAPATTSTDTNPA